MFFLFVFCSDELNYERRTAALRYVSICAHKIIGSRQHPEDLYNFLLENQEMGTIVEEAHSSECVLPEDEVKLHRKCMLWKSKRSYKWLLSRRRAAETTGGKAIFEMVYLNKAFVEGNWAADKVTYYTPYLKGDKYDILKDGLYCCTNLGLDFDEVYKRTNTSYKPDSLGRSDYKSASSVERIEAFLKLGR